MLLFTIQIPEQFGPIRTVAEGKGNVILIGTTRNFVLQGTLSGDFTPITQVLSAWQIANSYTLEGWLAPEFPSGMIFYFRVVFCVMIKLGRNKLMRQSFRPAVGSSVTVGSQSPCVLALCRVTLMNSGGWPSMPPNLSS